MPAKKIQYMTTVEHNEDGSVDRIKFKPHFLTPDKKLSIAYITTDFKNHWVLDQVKAVEAVWGKFPSIEGELTQTLRRAILTVKTWKIDNGTEAGRKDQDDKNLVLIKTRTLLLSINMLPCLHSSADVENGLCRRCAYETIEVAS